MKQTIYYILLICILTPLATSCKRVKLEDADKRFAEGKYYVAGDMYRKIYRQTSPKKRELRGQVALKQAESFRLTNNTTRANAAYSNALRYNPNDSTIHLQYARSLHKSGDYGQAAKQYEAFLKNFPDNRFALNGLEGTKVSPQWKKEPTLYKIKRMTLFDSTKGGEFSPMLLPPSYDQVYFSSNRKEALGDTISDVTGAKNNDIFFARKDESGNWMKPEVMTSPVNTFSDEGTPSFSASGTTMYYTFCPQDSIGINLASIYISRRGDGSWGAGSKIKIGSDTSSVYAHPAVSPSDRFLYFVSDMKGGYGGKDIWRAAMVGDLVEYIENLGPSINTAGDEMFPYMRNDSTLYFASDGHVGMGGLDIYKAVYDGKQKKWTVENMKAPINSNADDFGITFEGEKELGFFSSNRGDVKGYDHIYAFEYPTLRTAIEGYIVDKDDEFVTNATIRVVGNDGTNKRFPGKNDGTYSLDVSRGTKYTFLASAEGFLNTKMNLSTVSMEKDTTYFVDFVLVSINKPVVLENIFYDFDSANLRAESQEKLHELVELLELNPNVSIELSAHTDRKGSEEYNKSLSQRRAESVVNYLITKGIAPDRLTAVGKGKSEPKTVTKAIVKKYDFLKEGEVLTDTFIEALPVEQQETADQVNRRTEFKVLSITYNLE